jgi:hypothetical protein
VVFAGRLRLRPGGTTRRTVAIAGRAEALRRRLGAQISFIAASKATLFVRGIVPGKGLTGRFANIKADPSLLRGGDLTRYLTTLAAELRPVFGGPSPTEQGAEVVQDLRCRLGEAGEIFGKSSGSAQCLGPRGGALDGLDGLLRSLVKPFRQSVERAGGLVGPAALLFG